MKRASWWLISIVAGAALAVAGCGRDSPTSANVESAAAQAAKLARGQHLVEGVGMCHDCHTVTGEKGEPDMTRALMGATLTFRPTIDIPWADVAPAIAGLPTMTDDEAVHFFMSGERPGGVPPRPPMPRYKMARDEAEAVVAYLRSFGPKS